MTITRLGSNPKLAAGWDSAFGGKKSGSKPEAAAKKAPEKQAAPKKSPAKKAKGKK